MDSRFRIMAAYRIAATSLAHVGIIPEVQHALVEWIKATTPSKRGVLIGGLAMSFYAKPRTTDDVDLLFLEPSDIPEEVPGFKRYRAGAFQENATHVEVEVTTPYSFENLPIAVVRKVLSTAVEFDGLKVASREGMIALKLCSAQVPKRRFKDMADVASLLDGNLNLSMTAWSLGADALLLLDEIRSTLGASK